MVMAHDSVNSTSGVLSTSSDDCPHSVDLKNKAGNFCAFADNGGSDGGGGGCHSLSEISVSFFYTGFVRQV